MLFFEGSESLLDLKTGVGLSLSLVMSILNPLLGYIDLLSNLRVSSKRGHKKYIHIQINVHLSV